mgnify:CR=1 FL=1
MDQNPAENTESLKNILEEAGIEVVSIVRVPLPEHLRKWIAEDLEDEDESVDEVAEEFIYFHVETERGSFGVGFGAYPMLDLEGSGVSLSDIDPQFAAEAPPTFPLIIGLGEPEQLRKLWQLMDKKQAKK